MSNLQLVKSDFFGPVQCDFYNQNDEYFMTREQIGSALEYCNPRDAIAKIHRRNRERLEQFSRGGQTVHPLGGSQETVLYSARGIYEIIRWSRQPKADQFMDFVYTILESLRLGQMEINSAKQLQAEARLKNARTRELKLMTDFFNKNARRLQQETFDAAFTHLWHELTGEVLPEASVNPIHRHINDTAPGLVALETVKQFYKKHINDFFPRYGRVDDECIYIYSELFQKIIGKKFSRIAVLRDWADRGWIKLGECCRRGKRDRRLVIRKYDRQVKGQAYFVTIKKTLVIERGNAY